jgi:hypothetical protein
MWSTIEFKTKKSMEEFIKSNKSKYQMDEIFVNNKYCLEYRKLRVIDIK